MKKFLSYWKTLFAVALVAMTLSSCSNDDDDDDIIWDFIPEEITLEITDANGNNLLDPAVENNIVGENITLDYKGETYDILWDTPYPKFPDYKPESRATYVLFYGLAHHLWNVEKEPSETNEWIISIGEFERDMDHDVTIPVRIKNKTFIVRYVHDFWWNDKKMRDPRSKTTVYLDGKECEDGIVRIVL